MDGFRVSKLYLSPCMCLFITFCFQFQILPIFIQAIYVAIKQIIFKTHT